jgi:2'-phosphotransferase
MSSRRGNRGRSGGGGGRSLPREVIVSKKLSWLLRHGAEQEGLKLGAGGFVGVKDAVSHF